MKCRCAGPPKGVVLTHGNLEAQITSLVEAWEWAETDRVMPCGCGMQHRVPPRICGHRLLRSGERTGLHPCVHLSATYTHLWHLAARSGEAICYIHASLAPSCSFGGGFTCVHLMQP